jgi:hypothetical protein
MALKMHLPANHNDTTQRFQRQADSRGWLHVEPRRQVGGVVIGCVFAVLLVGCVAMWMFPN